MLRCRDRAFQAFIIYISVLLDNILLTVIVPILPDYLAQLSNDLTVNIPKTVMYKSYDLHYVPTILGKHPLTGNSMINFTVTHGGKDQINEYFVETAAIDEDPDKLMLDAENGSVGILLAAKALVQLAVTPLVGSLCHRLGYRIPVVFGTFCLFIASLVFASGKTYASLLFARSLQGVASSCIGVCGMSLVAQMYPEDEKRSKVMGIILGSVALGVLLGYPFGGILYDFVGKSAPFYILAICIFGNLVLQLFLMDLKDFKSEAVQTTENTKCCALLADQIILKIIIAIWISTSAMAILEPCLPIWLMENLHPKKWQIGTVFIPDSIGYFVGTNFFASIAYRVGQINISVFSLILVGLSCFIIPTASSVWGLLVPHFSLGLGIGILDAALIPMLASLVDAKYSADDSPSSESQSNYGAVYAIQQMSVSLAYSLGPIIGGEMAQYLGFNWLMFIVGSINITYGLLLLSQLLIASLNSGISHNKDNMHLTEAAPNKDYKRFYNTMDMP